MLNPLYETIDAHGHEHLINFNHVSHIKYTSLQKHALGRAGKSQCGPKGAGAIRVSMINGASILIACDWDGEDITEDLIRAYNSYFHRCHQHTTAKSSIKTQSTTL